MYLLKKAALNLHTACYHKVKRLHNSLPKSNRITEPKRRVLSDTIGLDQTELV